MSAKIVANVVARFRRAVDQDRPDEQQSAVEQLAVAPPGWEDTVKEMKKHKDIDNPWALAWYMKDKGAEPHQASDPKYVLAANQAMKWREATRR